jgi:hypothetical protein
MLHGRAPTDASPGVHALPNGNSCLSVPVPQERCNLGVRILVAIPEQPLQEPNAVQVLATCLALTEVVQHEQQHSFVLSGDPFDMRMRRIVHNEAL